MTERDRKKLLVVIDLVLAAAIAGSVAAAFLPLSEAPPTASPLRATTAPAQERIGSLEEYAVIYRRDLCRPIYDPPATQVTTAPVTLPIRLTGTMGEPGSFSGIFRTATNDTRLGGAGDTIDGAEIIEVTATSATVKFSGQTFKLTVQQEGKP